MRYRQYVIDIITVKNFVRAGNPQHRSLYYNKTWLINKQFLDFHFTPPARVAYKAKFTKNYLSFDCSTAFM